MAAELKSPGDVKMRCTDQQPAQDKVYDHRFQRTNQWMPVYTWLESLDTDEVVKSKDVVDWLTANPEFRDHLYSRHSRYHMMHYIKKCHVKILKRKEKQGLIVAKLPPKPDQSAEAKAPGSPHYSGRSKARTMKDDTLNIPTVDLSAFFTNGDEESKNLAKQVISQSCVELGFFQVVNHGIPLHLMCQAMDLCKAFFNLPDQEKLKSRPRSDAPVPAGYGKQPLKSVDKNEFLMMLPPGNTFNVLPSNPAGFREAMEEMFLSFQKTGELIEGILNDCLGLPTNFLKEFNGERTLDLMSCKRYFPATPTENIGISIHEDGNIVSFVFQDEVGGLEILKDGQWIPVVPCPDTLSVNIGDTIQVLSNKKYKSATHRVTRQGRNRHSFSFFYNLPGDKWVEPLPHFTKHIGEPPKYRGFFYKDYLALRIRNKTHPPARPEDELNITHYELSQEK